MRRLFHPFKDGLGKCVESSS